MWTLTRCNWTRASTRRGWTTGASGRLCSDVGENTEQCGEKGASRDRAPRSSREGALRFRRQLQQQLRVEKGQSLQCRGEDVRSWRIDSGDRVSLGIGYTSMNFI